ncbi:MAG: SDR family NAD(P)-dependent oxidoreductase [Thermoleophilia bacterium]|nr:SDR family NAD(P)-dependent oxidoreductase [Thermoleophilia bacterium]
MRDALGSYGTVVVLGGDSEIGRAIVERLVGERPATIVLAVRDPDGGATPLACPAAVVERVAFDATRMDEHPAFVEGLAARHPDLDLVLVAFGALGDQASLERDQVAALALAELNFTGAVSMLTLVAARLRAQGHGRIVVMSSFAAVRARRSNWVYGATKAGLDAFTEGLSLALEGSGVEVTVVRPGFVRTRMTRGLKEAPFAVDAAAVAEAVAIGLERGQRVVWAPSALRFIAWAVRLAPRALLQRL